MAIMNDLNAVCAATAAAIETANETPQLDTSCDDIELRLEKLMRLREKDIITPEEYQSRREAILQEV
jgi:hypothetical protein